MESKICWALRFVLLIFIPRNSFARVDRSDGRLGANVSSLLLPPHRCQCSAHVSVSFSPRSPIDFCYLGACIGCEGNSASASINDTIFRCNLTRNRRQTISPRSGGSCCCCCSCVTASICLPSQWKRENQSCVMMSATVSSIYLNRKICASPSLFSRRVSCSSRNAESVN